MRSISRVFAGIAVAGVATLGTLTMAGPASATGGGSLVDVTVQDILTGNEVNVLNDVQIPVAAAICGLDVDVLTSALVNSNKTDCKALSVAGQKLAFVKK